VLLKLSSRWANQWTTWLGGSGTWPVSFGLKPPVEREAQTSWSRVQAWRAEWAANPLGGEVIEVERSWSGLGRQRLPSAVSFATPAGVAAALGKLTLFERADARYRERALAWPDLAGPLHAGAGWMAELPVEDYRRFVSVVDWLSDNRDSGLYLRQLPIEGLDTKWLEGHAGPIARLLAARFGVSAAPLAVVAGLKQLPTRRRLRLLDPALRDWCRGLSDMEVPLAELRALELPARLALVVENGITAQACTDLPGTVLIMGGGFAVTELGSVPWLDRIPILYWGDIDTWGLWILAALRRYHPATMSCLMDEATLRDHLQLCSFEPTTAGPIEEGLTADEASLFTKLAGGKSWGPGTRLEQERLNWASAWATVEAMARTLVGTAGGLPGLD
jgi:Uncharacterized protein conserved in bacteria